LVADDLELTHLKTENQIMGLKKSLDRFYKAGEHIILHSSIRERHRETERDQTILMQESSSRR
jgi:hypothetical protein